ncbi:MAG TPA: BON domain-containing protein [Terracidiphilus sp.]|jgi:hypothetical protein
MKRFHILLKRHHLLRDLVVGVAATIVSCSVAAGLYSNGHPDDRQAIYHALTLHDLSSVTVDQDQNKGVIRLTGIVATSDNKDQAEQVAEQAAPGYSIDNQIQVNRAGL